MAIVLNSLTPTNPTVVSGSSINFVVNATETNSLPLTYQWQYSTNGINYTSSGLTDNTNPSYITSNLTSAQNGIYFRVVVSNGTETVFSNEVPAIGERQVTVVEQPFILTQVNPLIDYYPTSQTISVNQTFSFTVSSTLQNADISTSTLVTNIGIQWQVSSDNGSNWTNISSGGNITVNTVVDTLSTSPAQYYKYSTLTVNNTPFSYNLNQYRAVISYTGAINTPVIRPEILLLIDPQITVIRQPGTGNDTLQTRCYKTSDPTSGNIKVETSALSSANTSLSYLWQADLGDGVWTDVSAIPGGLVQNYVCILKPGTTATSYILELERVIFYNEFKLRCEITGSSGEPPVYTNTHTVYMTDVSVAPTVVSNTVNTAEDRYGNITGRNLLPSPIIRADILSSLDTARNTGINGDLSITYQRQNPGSSTWSDVTDYTPVTSTTNTSVITYSQFPNTLPTNVGDFYYTTPILRRDTDNGAKYRLKVSSSAIYTLSGTTKTINPYYGPEITLNVYRQIYIINQPASATVFANSSASFAVGVEVSSGSVNDVTYQWQYSTNRNTGWTNIPSGSPYFGVNNPILSVNPVTVSNSYRYFRCVMNVTNGLSSVTSQVAEVNVQRDYFLEISSINDTFLNEGQTHSWSVTATTQSQSQISYQWQKSTNFNPATQVGTWTDITGQTTNTLNFLSLATSDTGYYRLRLTSFGGEISYSNVARLGITALVITITENTPTAITVLEGQPAAYLFSCKGISSISSLVSYQWQRSIDGGITYTNIGTGFNSAPDDEREYSPLAFDRNLNNSRIRCRISAEGITNPVYTTATLITVRRRFTYFADVANKNVTNGSSLTLSLNPSWTGGNPTFQWQQSTNGGGTWSNISGETQDSLLIPTVDNSFNSRQYRCQINLSDQDEHVYSRGGVSTTVNVTSNPFPTVVVAINVISSTSRPTFYSLQTQKTGASIGTVICVGKPDGYVNNTSATTDDINLWKVSVSGSLTTSDTTSVVTSGSAWTANKPSWATSFNSPKWNLSDDRFKGYLEMRGQYLRASEFPELARMFGTSYGGTITGTYPRYNTNDIFRMPNLYGKKVMGTGNVDNNRGSVSITPLFSASGVSGGDKNVPGTIGGRFNYETSQQLPAGSPGVSGQPDGTAGVTDPATYTIGTYRSNGFSDVSVNLQPSLSGSVTYSTPNPVESFTDLPTHSHSAISVGWRQSQGIDTGCGFPSLASNTFIVTSANGGVLSDGPHGVADPGQSHGHGVSNGAGTINIVTDAGMSIGDTDFTLSNASRPIFDNALRFVLRNNESIPLNAPYFRLKYMIKAY